MTDTPASTFEEDPTCVVDGIRENYKPENGKTTGFLPSCKSEE